ncbi:hypothetical protein [uncultured Lactobacillus sp.]
MDVAHGIRYVGRIENSS